MSEVKTKPRSFITEVASLPGGVKIRDCIQCGTCTGSCPVAQQMDYSPRKVIAMVRADMRDEVLSSSSMWHCLSCYLCTVRCPKDIKPTEIFHALECIAIREGFKVKETNTPAMYRSFTDSIKANGRVHELGFMFKYYLRTWRTLLANPSAALKMLPLALNLLTLGRMPLMPKKVKGRKELKIILEKAKAGGGA